MTQHSTAAIADDVGTPSLHLQCHTKYCIVYTSMYTHILYCLCIPRTHACPVTTLTAAGMHTYVYSLEK